MTGKELLDGSGFIDEKYLREAESFGSNNLDQNKGRRRKNRFFAVFGSAAAVLVAVSLLSAGIFRGVNAGKASGNGATPASAVCDTESTDALNIQSNLIDADKNSGNGSAENSGFGIAERIDGGKDSVSKEDTRNILIIGADERGYQSGEDGYRSDTIVLCSINPADRKIRLASLSRDMLLLKYGTEDQYEKAQSLTYSEFGGSPELMLSTINLNFDLNITDIIIVNWAAAALAVNALGGLELNIPQEEIDNASITGLLTSVVEDSHIGTSGQFTEGGLQWCDGPKVVAYCRNRYIEGNDAGRQARLFEVLDSLLKSAQYMNLKGLSSLVQICFENIRTNLSIEELTELALIIAGCTIEKTGSFPAAAEMVPELKLMHMRDSLIAKNLSDEVVNLHALLFGTEHNPSEQVREISDNLAYLLKNSSEQK
ncbi:MAG TPA: hypothetical protein DCZ61_02605 [Lachnospiraceae bacterium]|nr:hypothetical protein [Lachnospiraceae bacterium]